MAMSAIHDDDLDKLRQINTAASKMERPERFNYVFPPFGWAGWSTWFGLVRGATAREH
jgi:hypothetical protein